MLRRDLMRYQDTLMRILDHHHTVVRTQGIVAVNRTLRRWEAGKEVLKQMLWRG